MKFKVIPFALSLGILWGSFIFVLGAWVDLFHGPTGNVGVFQDLYLGYSARPLGNIIGFVWGFGDGIYFGLMFSVMYNFFVDLFYGKKKDSSKDNQKEAD